MRTNLRASRLLATAVLLGWALVGTSLPASADPDIDELVEVGTDMSSAAVSVAADNAAAIAAEATATPPDNVSCTVGAFGGANVKAIEVPNQLFVNGKDLGVGNGDCSDLDVLDPDFYTAFLKITVQYRLPGQTTWNDGASTACIEDSVRGTVLIEECILLKEYPLNDPIQTYVRRLQFEMWIVGESKARSTRYFGPLPPDCRALKDGRCRPA